MSRTRGETGSSSTMTRRHLQVIAEAGTRWTLLTLIVAIPITVMPGFTYDVFNVPKFGVLVIGLSIAAGLYAFGRVIASTPAIPAAAWVVPIAVVGPLVIAWLFSPYRSWALFGQYSRLQGLVPYAVFAGFSVLIVGHFRGRERQLAWALAAAGGLVGAGLLLGMMGISAAGEATQAGTLGNSNYVGGFLAIALPVSLHLWLTERVRSYAAMAMVALTITGLILSYSQGGQAAAVAGAAVIIGTHIGSRWTRSVSLLIAAAIAVTVVGIVALNPVWPIGGFTAATRSQMWQTAFAMGTDSPLVGSGPNAFAIEAPRYRSLQDSLNLGGFVAGYTPIGIEYQTSDDAHSVPLSFYANAGLIGVIGLLGGWGWAIVRGVRARGAQWASPFLAATIAYVIQALISIDELTLRLGFWTAASGLVAATLPRQDPIRRESRVPRLWTGIGGGLALAVAVAGTWYGAGFIRADHHARQGARLFEAGRPEAGELRLRSALEFRDETLYRELLAGKLGLAALERGRQGSFLIEEMRSVNAYLEDLPDVGAIHAYARIMSYWGHFDPSSFQVALDLFHRASRLDPVNPLIKVETAEVLVDLGRPQDALSLLEPLSGRLKGRVPEYWASLSITRSELGDSDGAQEALEDGVAVDPGDCRVMLAGLLVAAQKHDAVSPAAGDVLKVRIECSPGLYNMFLRRLPPRVRPAYR